jgi:hypothetical protein
VQKYKPKIHTEIFLNMNSQIRKCLLKLDAPVQTKNCLPGKGVFFFLSTTNHSITSENDSQKRQNNTGKFMNIEQIEYVKMHNS